MILIDILLQHRSQGFSSAFDDLFALIWAIVILFIIGAILTGNFRQD
jgi:hypothetical protein